MFYSAQNEVMAMWPKADYTKTSTQVEKQDKDRIFKRCTYAVPCLYEFVFSYVKNEENGDFKLG